MKLKNFTKLWYALLIVPVLFVTSCSEDPVEPIEPISSFQFEVDAANYLTVHFTSHSQDAVSWSWSFGDDGTSTEENPSYTYSGVGDYNVELTVTSSTGDVSSKTEPVTVTDPDEALKLITGDDSKTWKLFREGVSMSLGPDASDPAAWWEGLTNDGSRACLYEQTFTFGLDGTYVFEDNGSFWAEYGLFNNVEGCDQNTAEACIDATAANMVNACGTDISTFLSGTHSFTYDASTAAMTLNGDGAWIGIPKLGSTAERLVPDLATSFKVSVEEFTGYDVMLVEFIYDGVYWSIHYANYSDAALEPELVTEVVVAPCDPLAAIAPAELSRTFASDAADQFVLLDTIASGSGIIYGADDPADAGATKVGKFLRHADVQYQELQLQTSPTVNDIDFTNITTVSMDVYLPSTNDYTGSLTDKVIIGLGETTCPPNWWEDNLEYSTEVVERDTWVTLTYDIVTPTFVANAENGASPKDRNDFDMVYISIGGGGHTDGGDFYIRNLKFN